MKRLIKASDAKHSQINFRNPPSLKVIESLLIAIYEESKKYRVWPVSIASASSEPTSTSLGEQENCYFLCSVMQEYLFLRHGGHFASRSGKLYRPTLGSDVRARIYDRLDGKRPADLPASRVVLTFAKPSIHLIASASRESPDSSLSMILAPSSRACHMNTREFAQYLLSEGRLSTVILGMATYHSSAITQHMFVVLRLKQGQKGGWLRLDRRAEDPSCPSFIFSGMRGPAKDEVCHILFC